MMAISAVVIVAGGSSCCIERSLRQAGVLEGFPD